MIIVKPWRVAGWSSTMKSRPREAEDAKGRTGASRLDAGELMWDGLKDGREARRSRHGWQEGQAPGRARACPSRELKRNRRRRGSAGLIPASARRRAHSA